MRRFELKLVSMDEADRSRLKVHARSLIDGATDEFTRGAITRDEWQRRVADALSDAYLRDDDPRWQSGFDGDAMLWREARSLILLAAPYNGTLLDVGCANGHLMESLHAWALERGQTLDVYGLELNPALADQARRRLPELADHIFTGNVSDWRSPRRFTYVRTGLEYVPPGDEVALLELLSNHFIEPAGRVIVGPVNDEALEGTLRVFEAAGMSDAQSESATDHRGKSRHVVWSTAATPRAAYFGNLTS
jgi:hypothetical protein